MSSRYLIALFAVCCTVCQLGCCAMNQCGCGASCGVADYCAGGCCAGGPSCGCPEASCCCPEPGCACPEASCCCPEASCCCPDPACGCPDSCGCGVGCGSAVRPGCPLLQRMRGALLRCCTGGCGGRPYVSEWSDCPPCACDNCDQYGNYRGGPYGSGTPHGRRARVANQTLDFGPGESETIYR